MATLPRHRRSTPLVLFGWLLIAAAAGVAMLAVFLILVSPREWTAWAALGAAILVVIGGGRLAFGG